MIQSLSWKVKFLSEEIEEKLSDPEKRYFKRHSSAIQSYTREMGGLELTVVCILSSFFVSQSPFTCSGLQNLNIPFLGPLRSCKYSLVDLLCVGYGTTKRSIYKSKSP